jgi:hypothetical protein
MNDAVTYREHIRHALTLDKKLSVEEIDRVLAQMDSEGHIAALNMEAHSGPFAKLLWKIAKQHARAIIVNRN